MIPSSVLLVTGALFLWNLAVIHLFAKWTYDYFVTWQDVPAEYVARKVIHILGGGMTALATPMFFEGFYWIIGVSSLLIAGYLIFWRMRGRLSWFQVEENSYEVHFAFAYGVVLLWSNWIGDIWVGLIAVLFMSFGDSATGLVRAFNQKRHIKTWDGTIAMFIVSSVIGYWVLGYYGVFIAAAVSLVEKIPGIDDNITIPLVSVILTYIGRFILNI
jgi:phytol kinase